MRAGQAAEWPLNQRGRAYPPPARGRNRLGRAAQANSPCGSSLSVAIEHTR